MDSKQHQPLHFQRKKKQTPLGQLLQAPDSNHGQGHLSCQCVPENENELSTLLLEQYSNQYIFREEKMILASSENRADVTHILIISIHLRGKLILFIICSKKNVTLPYHMP
jgi:hypothetical protein